MPRVPIAFYPRGLASPALGAGIVPSGARRLAYTINRGVAEMGAAIIEPGRQRQVLEARTAGLKALNDAQLAAEAPDVAPEDMQRVFDEHFEHGLATAKESLGDFQSYGTRLEGELRLAAEPRRMGLVEVQRRREREAGLAALEARIEEGVRAVALAPTRQAALEARASVMADIDASDRDPVEKGRLRRHTDERFDQNAAYSMMIANPVQMLQTASNQQSWSVAFPALADDEQSRNQFRSASRAEIDRRDAQARESLRDRSEALDRAAFADLTSGNLTLEKVKDYVDHGLDPSLGRVYLNASQQSANADRGSFIALDQALDDPKIPEDVKIDMLRQGLSDHTITTTQYDQKKAKVQAQGLPGSIDTPIKRTYDLIGSIKPSPLLRGVETDAILSVTSEMERAATEAVRLNPAATDEELRQIVVDIGVRSNFQQKVAPTIPPRVAGPRRVTQETYPQILQETVAQKGNLTQEEYQREMRNLRSWKDYLDTMDRYGKAIGNPTVGAGETSPLQLGVPK